VVPRAGVLAGVGVVPRAGVLAGVGVDPGAGVSLVAGVGPGHNVDPGVGVAAVAGGAGGVTPTVTTPGQTRTAVIADPGANPVSRVVQSRWPVLAR
jgi:hypothetical protein